MSPIVPEAQAHREAQPMPPRPSDPPAPSPADVGAGKAVLATKGLSVWYGPSLALRDITIAIPRNQITALIGPSGCGKSTLLRCFNRMNDLIPGARMEGEITFDGERIDGPDVDAVSLRRRIGMVFQKPNPFPKSIYQNVAWGARINGYRGDMDELVERSLRRAALWDEVKDKLHRSGLDLSGGQQQRLCIARTLAVEPEVILMDEPCSALDPISTARVEDLMDDLKADYTIVIVTHNMQQARRTSDMTACLMLDEGSGNGHRTGIIAEFSPTDRLFTNPTRPPDRSLHHREDRMTTRTAELREPAAAGTHLHGAMPTMAKPKILVIEDERSLVEVLSYNLAREGFEVLTAYDGQDGLRQAQLKLPDLMVLDLMLPVKSGLDVCRDLRRDSRTREIPIIMVTAKAEESDQLIGFATGADDYVTKPYSTKVLVQRITKRAAPPPGRRRHRGRGGLLDATGSSSTATATGRSATTRSWR